MMDTGYWMITKITRSYVVIGITLYLIIFLYWLNSVNYYNVLNVTTFLSYAYLLWICVNKDEDFFSSRRLWLTVFIYSAIFVTLYLLLSYFYEGNTFLFSNVDARKYERYSFRMKDMEFVKAIRYISRIWDYSDWGAPMSMALMLKLVPSKLFVNFIYILMNTISSLMLFDMGRIIGMSKKYSYIASLSYSIASYSIFMMGSYLKEETFVLLIVLSMWCLYKYRESSKIGYFFCGGVASFLLIFFRVPTALFVWISYASLLLLGESSHVKKMLFTLLGVFVSIMVIGFWQYSSSRYANDGDFTTVGRYASSSFFQRMVGFVSILIGPFPTLYHITGTTLKSTPLLGSGVLFKFLLFLPFWKGLILCIKMKKNSLFPLYVFTIANMLGLLVVLRIDFRFAMIGMPFFMLAAFWYMDMYDSDADESVRKTPYYYWTNLEFSLSLWIVFIVTIAWNVLVREQSSDVLYIEHLRLWLPGM